MRAIFRRLWHQGAPSAVLVSQMQSHAIPHARASLSSPGLSHRFEPVVHIVTGETVAIVSRGMRRFGDAARFSASGFEAPTTSPSHWLSDEIESVFAAALSQNLQSRPIHVAAPSPALLDSAARGACLDALHKVRACAQEIVLEFDDWVLGAQRRDLVFGLSRFKSVGFRLSINATSSWQMRSSEAVRLLIDSVRVSARALFEDTELAAHCHELSLCGIDLIIDGARWRDAGDLGEFGALYATNPMADA